MEHIEEIGKRIRELRLRKSMTQDALAKALGITPQAVSKWENGVGAPDIVLLPNISIELGVTIDELFALSDEDRLNRIDHMLEDEDFLSQDEFESTERFLKNSPTGSSQAGRVLRKLADLYCHRARGYKRLAEHAVKRSLEVAPGEKEAHSLLCEATNGAVWDWCCTNHHELIDYYYEFLKKNPTYRPGYMWLLDNLLDDLRLEEAELAVEQMERLSYTFHVPLYRGWIAAARGDYDGAEALWKRMTDEFPQEWRAWSSYGDAEAKLCRYDKSVELYEKAISLETPPRLIDNYLSIAQIREIQGRYTDAATAYQGVLDIFREDWGTTEGATIESYRNAMLVARSRGSKETETSEIA